MATPKANYRKIQGELESKRRFESTKKRGQTAQEFMKCETEGRAEPLLPVEYHSKYLNII